MKKWVFNPIVCKKKEDGTLWSPSGDTPFPINGYNFIRLRKAKIGWIRDATHRWIFVDSDDFEVVNERNK